MIELSPAGAGAHDGVVGVLVGLHGRALLLVWDGVRCSRRRAAAEVRRLEPLELEPDRPQGRGLAGALGAARAAP